MQIIQNPFFFGGISGGLHGVVGKEWEVNSEVYQNCQDSPHSKLLRIHLTSPQGSQSVQWFRAL
jgi:hypothetical protein